MILKKNKEHDTYRFSRIMYIIEAALEYFISIATGTIYLAKLTAYLGFSDALTGVLTSFVSLGCGFQLLAIFFSSKTPVKRFVTVFHIISQVLFALLYLVPVTNFTQGQKTVIFVILLLSAHVIHNMINSPKINWFMSLVDDDKRGKFTANKEMVSLGGGIVFSYLLGSTMDHFENKGEIKTAFIICGVGLMMIMVFHSLTLILSKEKTKLSKSDVNKVKVSEVLKNKNLWKLTLVAVLWNAANYITISFSGTYQTQELAFSTTFASVIIMCGSFSRVLFSKPFGKYADKFSFCKMLILCFAIEAVAFGINIFTIPKNGAFLFFVYYVLHSIGMAGINSATINLIYDYVPYDQRTMALAVQQTFAGCTGFFVTLAISPLVAWVQNNGNHVFGIHVYAQQLLSLLSCLIICALEAYLFFVIKKIEKQKEIVVTPVSKQK